MNKTKAEEKIKILIEKYENVKKANKLRSYTEEETKNGFIIPLFEILGWDFSNKEEVSAEESVSAGRVDFGLYLNNRIKFYLETKKLSADLHNEDFANQAIRYSWNKGATWAVLTDFESIKVFNAQDIEKSLSDKLFFEIPYNGYIERFEQLWLLSREAFEEGLIDKEAEKYGKKLQKISVTALLYKDLQNCRDILTKDLGQWNPKVNKDLLDEGVQKLLDRLIFIRVAEDRGVEPSTLIPLIRNARANALKQHLYQAMIEKFRELNDTYNSDLFKPHPFELWEEYTWATERVINILYGKKGYYEYDFKVMPADVLGAVYENYLNHRLSRSKKGATVLEDAKKRKEHGIYYTPSFVVDYIVKNALGPVLDKCKTIHDLKKIKVLDPACGSGSFLIKALEMINEKYKKLGAPGNTYTKIKILTENIYGVDLDEQAVEIARLNLLINALDERLKLPLLINIKNGNSLISGGEKKLEKCFDKNFGDKKPFNWEEEFPEVFKQGGFDVIIGNPPYVTQKRSEVFNYKWNTDLYLMFFELILKQGLLKSGGYLGFITPRFFLVNKNTEDFREYLLKNVSIEALVESSPFLEANTECVITIIKNIKPQNSKISIFRETEGLINHINDIKISTIIKNPSFAIITDVTEKISDLLKKIEIDTVILKDISDSKRGMEVSKNDLRGGGDIKALIGEDTDRYSIVYGNTHINSNHKEYKRLKGFFAKKNLIFLRRVADSLISTINPTSYAFNKNIYGIKITDSNYDSKYILALINSKLLSFYYRRKFSTKKADLFPEIQKYLFDGLPIKKIGKSVQNKFIGLVDSIYILQDKLRKSTANSNEWQRLRDEIVKVDKKINEDVYNLYRLTAEEIRIIEDTEGLKRKRKKT